MRDPEKPTNGAADVLPRWLEQLRVGEPLRREALTLVPVYADAGSPAVTYQTLAGAMELGVVTLTEAAQATVPTLRLVNKGELPVLIIDGEEVIGGLQNRVVNTSLLVPPAGDFELPVSCVEHGRWRESGQDLGAGETAYPRLRGQKAEQVTASYATRGVPVADQGAVWAEVADRHQRVGAHSDTGAMRDAYAEREADLLRAQEQLRCPADGPVGVIALVGGRAACADIFDRAETLRAYWPRLVRSYTLEALGARSAPPSCDSARRLLRRPLKACLSAFPSSGLGHDVRISGNGVVGAALVHEGAAVHTALFRRRRSDGFGPDIRRPSQRARRYSG